MSVLTNIGIAALGVAAVGGAAYKGVQSVNVVNTPSVSVTNTPNVNVANTPNVNVPNGVAITTMPSVQVVDSREPVSFELTLNSEALSGETTSGFYTVPAGKRLTITHISGFGTAPTGVYVSQLALTVGGGYGSQHIREWARMSYMPIENSDNRTVGTFSDDADVAAESGEQVGMLMGRSSAFLGSGNAYGKLNVNGYLTTNN